MRGHERESGSARRRSPGVPIGSLLVAAAALALAGCPGSYHDPSRLEQWERFAYGRPWAGSPPPCISCHGQSRIEQWRSEGLPQNWHSDLPEQESSTLPEAGISTEPPAGERQPETGGGGCEPYLLVGAGGPGGVTRELEIVHLPAPGAGPTDCRLVSAPLVEREPPAADEMPPLRPGLYRLVWYRDGEMTVPRPMAVWLDPARPVGGSGSSAGSGQGDGQTGTPGATGATSVTVIGPDGPREWNVGGERVVFVAVPYVVAERGGGGAGGERGGGGDGQRRSGDGGADDGDGDDGQGGAPGGEGGGGGGTVPGEDGGESTVPEGGGVSEEPEDTEEEERIEVQILELREIARDRFRFKLLLRGDRKVSPEQTLRGNPTVENRRCERLSEKQVRCSGVYEQPAGSAGSPPPRRVFYVYCEDAPGPCLRVRFAPPSSGRSTEP